MKIPVYRSTAQPRTMTPGTAMRGMVRQNPQAMAQAELAKAAPMSAALEGAAKFATTVWQASQEAQFNEAALAVEEGMREAERTLSKTKDIYNVLDGKNMWQSSMDEIRDKIVASVGNRDLQRKLSFSFEQNEIASRFRLRGIVDKKILAAEQAALAARQDATRRDLAKVGTTVDEYNVKLGIVNSSADRAVKGGRYSLEGVSKANKKLRQDIAESYLANKFNFDPNTAMNLFNMMGLQDEVMAGTMTPEEAMAKAGVTDEYALHVLYNLDREVAVKVIKDNLEVSLKFFDAQNKLENDQQAEQNDLNTKAYNLLTSLEDGDVVTQDQIKQVMGDAAYNALPEQQKTLETMNGYTAKDILNSHLERQFALTPDQQTRVEKAMAGPTFFATNETRNGLLYNQLFGLAKAGELTVDELNSNKMQITEQDNNTLRSMIETSADEAFNEADRLIAKRLNYVAEQAKDKNDRLAQASQTAYQLASGELLEAYSERISQENPMTRTELREFAKKKVEEFGDIYRAELLDEYEGFVKDTVQTKLPGLTIDLSNPFQSLDDYFAGLDANTQQLRLKNYTLYKRLIKSKYGNQGLGF